MKIIWEDCCICFECPSCGKEIIVDSQSEPRECSCGNKYFLETKIKTIPLGVIGSGGVR